MTPLHRSPYLIPLGIMFVLGVALLSGRDRRVDTSGRPVVVYAHPPCPPELMALYRPIWDRFKETHPDIRFEVLHVTGNYEDKIKVMFAGNVAPDVIFMYPAALPAWVDLGALHPLDTLLERHPQVSRTDYFPAMLETFSYEGKCYGLPKDASVAIMQYNVEMFRRCGVPFPSPDWTWKEMVEAAQTLTRDTDGDGRADQWGINPFNWWVFVWQNGGEILDQTKNRCVLKEPQALEALEFWAALRWKYEVTPTPEATADLGNMQLFALGKVGMHFEMYPVVSIFRKQCDFEWDLAHMPTGPSGKASEAVGSALAVTCQSANKEAAFEFVRWMTSPEGMKGLVSVESPSCVRLARSPVFLEGAGPPASKQVAVEAMEYAHLPLQHPRYAEIMDALYPELEKAQRGVLSVKEALNRAVPQVNAILERD